MKAIWKFPIKMHYDKITAPVEQFLTAQMQRDTLCIWAIVDTEKEDRTFAISVMGTGWCWGQLDEIGDYIGTVQDGIYVWHVFTQPVYQNKKGNDHNENERTGNRAICAFTPSVGTFCSRQEYGTFDQTTR